MNDIIEALDASVRSVCGKYGADDEALRRTDGWNPSLWSALESIGVTTLSVPEEYGGSGGDVVTAVAVLEVLGEHAAAVPFAETALLAGRLLSGCGVQVPPGPLAAIVAGPELQVQPTVSGVQMSGVARRVPWARAAEHLVVLAEDRVILLRRAEGLVAQGTNIAGEPRDDVAFDCAVPAERVYWLRGEPQRVVREQRLRMTLARAALIAGAARRALELTVAYAGEREQFGRPIGKFQAVQQHLAAMAGEVLLTKIAVEAAAVAVDADSGAEVAVAAAKTVAGQAAGLVASLAHQVHGALGYTEEHPLRHSTTRLWAWRDEAGNEAACSAVLDQHVLAAGKGGLWPLISGAAYVPVPTKESR
ncbi:acyl-CoA dehydrogenase family protein [Kribbella solani]|uniref:acyl-CoA dehydrogenase family protein n=1 Tax=Kribbella solani TaxID=236067 RepID=UPI0029B0E7AE|nr:acyl-CoA dehydrogenase family protein [Kribbella solani]MDX2968146.1 acyl-CoA/acyl-ACP dehydrogenase [Kribbella solani]